VSDRIPFPPKKKKRRRGFTITSLGGLGKQRANHRVKILVEGGTKRSARKHKKRFVFEKTKGGHRERVGTQVQSCE